MRIITRYVVIELGKVILLSLTALTLMMIIVGVAREAIQQNLPPAQIFWLIPYILPDALRVAVPVTVLLAATSVFGRMSGDNEVIALKSLGISPMTILWPILTLAFLLSLVTVWLNDLAVSWGRNGAQRVVIEAVEEIAYSMLKTQRRYSSSNFAINVKRVEDRRLIRVTLSLQQRDNTPAITITAEQAELRSDLAEGLLKIFLYNSTIVVEGQVTAQFPGWYEQEIPLPDAAKSSRSANFPSRMALCAIPEKRAEQEVVIEQAEQELAALAAYQMLCGDFDELTSPTWDDAASELGDKWEMLHRLRTEPYRRWSAGFSCLCFAWVGAPMAIWLRNRDFLTSFFLCFLPILIVYYPLLIYGVDGAKAGTIPPYSVWAGNIILLGWGIYLLRKVVRY